MTRQHAYVHRVCWDTCICIDCLEKREPYRFIEPMVNLALNDQLKIVVSAVAILETDRCKKIDPTTGKIVNMEQDESDELIQEFFDTDFVIPYAVDEAISEHAKMLRRKFDIQSKWDAIHVATALEKHCAALITNDGERRRLSGSDPKRGALIELSKKVGGTPPLEILTPEQFCGLYITDLFILPPDEISNAPAPPSARLLDVPPQSASQP